jgi:glycosyltransferase involved in cell wall biosynthesis
MVTHSLYESDGRVMRYAEALAARGNEVEVFALQKKGKPKEEMIAGVHVFRIHARTFEEKKKAAFLVDVGLFFLKTFWIITWRHLRKPYDLLHIHSIPDFMVFVGIVPKLTGAKIILDIHDILPELYASKFKVGERSVGFRTMLVLERASAAFANHVIIANHIWRDRLIDRCISPSKCTAVLNYPDESIFHPMLRDRDSESLTILFPGTLNHHQGLDVAIRAFAKVKDKVSKVFFHIYGEGRSRNTLAKLVVDLNLQGRVLFESMVPIREIAHVMANADLAVVPKRGDSFGNEAFSTKILEFMSVGVPVIVSNTKIDKFYFNDSVVKFFQDGDESDLAKTMLQLINDSELRKQMVENASKFVRGFSWDANQHVYLELVDSLVSGNRQAHSTVVVPKDQTPKACMTD